MSTKARFQIFYWDAAVIEAAKSAGCTELLTDGQDYGGIRVTNPFR